VIIQIENVFSQKQDYNCFACGPKHPFGLHLNFFYDDEKDEVFTRVQPHEFFAGFPGILHGGLQATILDDLAFWGTWMKFKKSGFTYDMRIRYKRKCPVNVLLEGRVSVGELRHHLVDTDVRLLNPETSEIYTAGTVRYYVPDVDPREALL
jgi:acyl-coenzyme A thioesterase PaaI-like protein